jgi:hypothetical protein
MSQTFINSRFEQIEKRFNEIEILLRLAQSNQDNTEIYQALCRSAHVLLVGHFEGLYKEICRDVIDDINANTYFYQVKKIIFNTHCDYFIQNREIDKSAQNVRVRLREAFKEHPSNIRFEPFLFVDNKNPTPDIVKTILERFGINNFFWSIDGSDLDVVFEDQKSTIDRIRKKLKQYALKGTQNYPYTIDTSIYNPIYRENVKKTKTLWEDFLNNLLKERHSIIHGNTIENPNDNESLFLAKNKIEILVYTIIINICSAANPIFFLSEETLAAVDEEFYEETVDDIQPTPAGLSVSLRPK